MLTGMRTRGASGYLVKPFHGAALVAVVELAIDSAAPR
jgi:DNA-binding response OmpR family regulator